MCGATKFPVYKLPVEKDFDLLQNSPTFTAVVCSHKALKRKIIRYNENKELPPLNDFSVAVGMKPLVHNVHNTQLVYGMSSSAGRAQTPQEFSAKLMEVKENLRVEARLLTSRQPPLPSEQTPD